jgi:hypothetical protein
MLRSIALGVALLFALLRPAPCFAERGDAEPYDQVPSEAPSLMSYGFKGFWLGGELGLSVGFLSTGSTFERGDWRNLVFGAGLGALSGVAAGVALAMVDTGTPPPATGWYILRDGGYGTLLGGLSGAAVGALFVIDSGRPKDILTGASIGSLVGVAVGVAFGIIEAGATVRSKPPAYNSRRRREPSFWFSLRSAPTLTPGRTPSLMPTIFGQF